MWLRAPTMAISFCGTRIQVDFMASMKGTALLSMSLRIIQPFLSLHAVGLIRLSKSVQSSYGYFHALSNSR